MSDSNRALDASELQMTAIGTCAKITNGMIELSKYLNAAQYPTKEDIENVKLHWKKCTESMDRLIMFMSGWHTAAKNEGLIVAQPVNSQAVAVQSEALQQTAPQPLPDNNTNGPVLKKRGRPKRVPMTRITEGQAAQ